MRGWERQLGTNLIVKPNSILTRTFAARLHTVYVCIKTQTKKVIYRYIFDVLTICNICMLLYILSVWVVQ